MLGALVVLTGADRASGRDPAPGHIEAPTIEDVMVSGRDVDLVWTWADRRSWDRVVFRVTTSAWDPDVGQFIGEDLLSEEGLENAESYHPGALVQGTLSYSSVASGLRSFRVEALAWNRPVNPPHHESGHEVTYRAWTRRKVMVGVDGWSVVPLPGIRGDMLHDAHDPEFRFFYELYRGSSLIQDCGADYRVGWPAAVHSHDCDWETGERALVLANPEPGYPGVWRLTFGWGGGEGRFGELYLEAVQRSAG